MYNHAPDGYDCPFCLLAAGGEDELTAQHDIVLRREHALAFVASRWWPNNQAHVLVIPTTHHENLYDTPHLTDPATPSQRAPYIHRLRTHFSQQPPPP